MILVLAACRGGGDGGTGSDPDSDRPPTPVDEQPVLTVDRGWGDGAHPVGAEVRVWADVDPRTEVVTGWTGDVDAPLEWNAALVMPDHDLTVSAAIEPVDAPLEARGYALAGGQRDTLGVRVPSPAGVVVFFHGAAYSVDELRDAAARTITMQLVRAGWSVVALESEAEARSGTGGWSSSLTGNTDLDNVAALIDALRADGTLPAGVPWVAAGMSSGGVFAHTVGAALDPAAVVAWCAAGTADAMATTDAPTLWLLAGNDQTFPSAPVDAVAHQASLTARGVASELHVHPATELYDERFLRVEGVDAERSRRIAEALREQGAVDDGGDWLVTGGSVDLDTLDGIAGLTEAQQTAVTAEIEIMAADHELYDDLAGRAAAWIQEVAR